MEMEAVYKCRLCGERYKTVTTGLEVAERLMVEMNVGICSTLAMAPLKTGTHRCGGHLVGSLGLADFLGWEAQP